MNIHSLSSRFKTDLSYIIKGSSVMVSGQALVSLIAFLSSIAFANLVPKEVFGTYQFVLTIAEFIMVFSLSGLTHAVTRSVAQGYEGTTRFAFKKNILWSIPAFVIGGLISTYYFLAGQETLAIAILIAGLSGPVLTNAKLYQNHLIGKKLFGKTSTYSVLGNLLPTLAIVGTLFVSTNLLVIIGVYCLSHTLVNLVLFFLSDKTSSNTNVDSTAITYAQHLSIQNIITRTAAEIDKILLFHYAGAVALATYFFAITVPRQFQHFFKSAKMIVLPKVSTRPFAALQSELPKKVFLLYIFIIPITIGYILIAPYLFTLFFPQYGESVFVSQLYALIFLFLPLTIFQDAIIGHAKQHILYKTNIVSAIVKIGTTVALVPPFGINGVLASVLLSQAFASLQITYYFYRERSDATPATTNE